MMKIKITGRDIKVFFFGFLTFFLLSAIYNWEGSVAAFKEGYEAGRDSPSADNTNTEKSETTAVSDLN